MGEIVVSSDEEEVRRESEERKDGMVRWDRFLPRIVLRVLLVETDDSTRQIIAALLKKCSYKVVAVADGLKAWEVVKGRPEDIDLILTEVDLPSISGFALLSLIMDDEACKNIPVIMMSYHDSVSMVHKCMLRGAADFLMKPIRRNELTNLWQHVWKRQYATTGGHNNAASNNSSGSMACLKRKNKERIENGNDTQSSCTKPDFEAESAYLENVQDLDLPQAKRSKSYASDKNSQMDEEYLELDQTLLMHERKAGGSDAVTSKIAVITTQGEELERDKHMDKVNITSEACENNAVVFNSSGEAIDLIGAFDNHRKRNFRNVCSIDGINKSEHSLHLDLSLRRFQPSATERHTLNHSNFSPFSRYQTLQLFHSTLTSVSNQQKEYGTDSDKQFSSLLSNYNSDSSCRTQLTQKSVFSLATNQSEQADIPFPCHQNAINFTNQITKKQGDNLDSLEVEGHVSPATDCSANSSLCNSGASQLNSIGCGSVCGSNGNINLVAVGESKNESVPTQDGNSRRSIHREAALTKFRSKRKDRCYEKKVRYENRKKLAEQRPRVKGQFVRQAHTDEQRRRTHAHANMNEDLKSLGTNYIHL